MVEAKPSVDSWASHIVRPAFVQDLDFANEAAFAQGIPGFSLSDNFIMRWRGDFNVPSADLYTFETSSDDGSML
jgi:hypothetical protein